MFVTSCRPTSNDLSKSSMLPSLLCNDTRCTIAFNAVFTCGERNELNSLEVGRGANNSP